VDRVVEKIIKTSDDTQINELLSKIEQLNGEISIKCLEIDKIRQEFSTKTKEMENIFQNEMSKKDKELDELRHKLDIPVTNSKVNMLQETLVKLKKELTEKNQQNDNLKSKIEELESIKINQGAVFMKGSNLTENL
jgi:predicted RNase H-like nuclease (RuvC/YqgF family)